MCVGRVVYVSTYKFLIQIIAVQEQVKYDCKVKSDINTPKLNMPHRVTNSIKTWWQMINWVGALHVTESSEI